MRKNVLNSPRLLELKKKRRKIFLKKVSIYLVVLTIIFAGLAYLSRLPSVNITSIEITGNKVLDSDGLKSVVSDELTGNYFLIFPKTNIFLYSKNSIKKHLLGKFKRLKDVKFSLVDKRILSVSISERAPDYVWCGAQIPEMKPDTEAPACYFLDDSGYIFDEAPYFSGDVYFKFYGSVYLEGDTPIGSYFAPGIFSKFLTLKEELDNMTLRPVALLVEEDGVIKFLLSGLNNTMPEIILKTDLDFESALGNLQSALDTDPLKSEFKNKYSSLEYIDLRFGNRVYYRFK